MPGLVDAHCHVGLDAHGGVDEATTEAQAVADRDAGALLLRDCGSPVDTSWIHDRDDLPRLIRAGRHIARTRRYIRNYAHEVEPEDLTAYVVKEAQRGDGWVKLVGDWISRDAGDLAPSFPPEAFAAAIEAAHEQGARVTAHCFGETVLPTLIEAGIDCIEHGTGLTTDLIDTMVARGTALVPTVVQLEQLPRVRRGGRGEVPGVRRHDARPVRPPPRDDHVGLRGGRADLRRHGRRRSAAARRHRRRGAGAGGATASPPRTRSAPRPGGPASGSAGTPRSRRARPPTSWSTTATRSRT